MRLPAAPGAKPVRLVLLPAADALVPRGTLRRPHARADRVRLRGSRRRAGVRSRARPSGRRSRPGSIIGPKHARRRWAYAMGMSASPLERITPALAALARHGGAQPGREALTAARSFWPHLAVLTAFWIYVALSNVMYANNMQASLSSMKIEHVFAPWDARLIQHLLLYPLFLLSMWRSLRTGWRPLWKTVPIQLLCAVGFAVLAAPALALGERLVGDWNHEHKAGSAHAWTGFIGGPELPTWIASATNFLVTYGFGLALVTGFAFYQRLRDSQLRSAALERALTQAHLTTLRMQLSPHTLFNLLHTIRGQISWDPPAAQAMVVQLGDLLRSEE